MKLIFNKAYLILLLLATNSALSQVNFSQGQIILPNTEAFPFETAMTKDDFVIYISLPLNFDISGDTKYPVIYLTDANGRFALFREIYGTLQRGREIPPMIVVGIGYELARGIDIIAKRSRDLTPIRSLPTESEREAVGFPGITGDGPKFMKFITEELIPYIDNNYPTNDTRIYTGFSAGGLFGLSLLFDTKYIFSHYIIGSPALHYDEKGHGEFGNIMASYMFKHESDYADNHSDLDANVFLSVGTREGVSMLPNLALFHSILSEREYPNLNLEFRVFDGESHDTAPSITYIEGLRFVSTKLSQ